MSEKYFNSNRCITADNFFTSIPLVNTLWSNGLEYLGYNVKKKNKYDEDVLIQNWIFRNNSKQQIRNSRRIFEKKKRAIGSSIFAFKDHLSLVSYVPKKNKSVILVSSKHHEEKINENKQKPEIIIDYNKNKGILA